MTFELKLGAFSLFLYRLREVHLVGVLFFDQIAIEAFRASFSSELSFTHLQRRIDLRALLANAVSCTLGTKRFVALQALPITGFMR
jgi:hypothetical protein